MSKQRAELWQCSDDADARISACHNSVITINIIIFNNVRTNIFRNVFWWSWQGIRSLALSQDGMSSTKTRNYRLECLQSSDNISREWWTDDAERWWGWEFLKNKPNEIVRDYFLNCLSTRNAKCRRRLKEKPKVID